MIQLKYNQDNLELMSKERELETDEIHNVNDFYGQASILRKYSNYNRSIKVVYEHSIVIHDLIWYIDKESIIKNIFVSSPFRLGIYKQQLPHKNILNIGSIINYAIAIDNPSFAKNNFKSSEKKNGSVFFPNHSTHHLKSTINSLEIIQKLKSLPIDYHPISICMYWKDIQHQEHLKYIQNGFKVVSAGHIYDKLFYFRLYDILRNFKYTLGSGFGSFMFHAARSGSLVVFPKELRILDEKISITTKDFIDKDLEERIQIGNNFNERVYKLFSNKIENYSKEQMQFIETYSSPKLLKPWHIKTLLLFADLHYYLRKIKNKVQAILNRTTNSKQ